MEKRVEGECPHQPERLRKGRERRGMR